MRCHSWDRQGTLHVITEDVGGAFGLKSGAYPEYPRWWPPRSSAARFTGCRAARKPSIERQPGTRQYHGRRTCDRRQRQISRAARASGAKSRGLCRLRRHSACDQQFRPLFSGHVRHSILDIGVQCVYTNTLPTGPYRGAGRPEANYVIERLVEEAARITGIDPVAIRKRNLIPSSAMPYKTASALPSTAENFLKSWTRHWRSPISKDSRQRKRNSEADGKLRGLGISCFLEHSGGVPNEGAYLTFPRQRHAGRQPECRQYRTGPRHGLSATCRRTARHRRCACKAQARRQRSGDQGLAFGRLALDHHGRHRGRAHHRNDAGERPASLPRMHSKPTRRTSPIGAACLKWSAPTARSACSTLAAKARRNEGQGRDRGKSRHQARRRYAADFPQWLPYRGSRGDAGDRPGRCRCLLRRRRLRHHARPQSGAWSGARRHSAGLRAGAAGERGLRFRQRPARYRLLMDYAMPRAHHMPSLLRTNITPCRRKPIRLG